MAGPASAPKADPVDLYSPLSPEEIARKLKAIMDDPMKDASGRVMGNGTQYEMNLAYVRRKSLGEAGPELKANMEPFEGGGTRITGTIGLAYTARQFLIAWIGFLSIFVLIGLALLILIPDVWFIGAIFIAIPGAMMLMGIVGARGIDKGSRNKKDAAEIMAFLHREIDAVPVPEA